mgnify:CR=1 FL=1
MRIAVIIRVENGKEPETVFAGSVEKCKAKLFNHIIPSETSKNICQRESDFGYSFSVEELKENKWKKVEYYLQKVSQEFF